MGRKRPQVLGAAPERRTHRKPDRLCSQRQAPNPSPRKVVPSEGTRCVRPEGGTRGCWSEGGALSWAVGRNSRGNGRPWRRGHGPRVPMPVLRLAEQIARDRPPRVRVPGWGERGFSPSAPLAVTAAGCGDGSPGRGAHGHGDRTARSRGAAQPGMHVGAAGPVHCQVTEAQSPACHPRRAF